MVSIDITTLIASALVSVVGNGLLGNYLIQKLRNEQDTRVKRLQAHLDRTKFVHRVQFETEFAAMKAIWEKVVGTRGTMAGLRAKRPARIAAKASKVAGTDRPACSRNARMKMPPAPCAKA